jgi:recombination protein RecA
MSAASRKALEKFEERFAKVFGEDSLATPDPSHLYEVISTGSLAIDYITGVGGIVEGRLTEIWGPDGIGKTTLCLLICAEAQKKHPNKLVAWIDMENAFDAKWAADHGIDITNMKVYTPHSAEDVADAMKDIIRSGLFSVVVLDSVGGMISEKAKQKDADEAVVADVAKIVTRMVQIAATEAPLTSTAVVIINQVRANISLYGADTTTSGGFALKHVTTLKLNLKRGKEKFTDKFGGEEIQVGHEVRVYTERNRVSPAYRTIGVILFNQASKWGPLGIDLADEAFIVGRAVGVITQEKTSYVLPDGSRHIGRPKAIEALRGDPGAVSLVRERVLASSLTFEPTEGEALMEMSE